MATTNVVAQRRAEMFPTLDAAQIKRMRAAGHERAFRAGEVLYEQGDPSRRSLVVLEGSVEISHPYAGGDYTIAVSSRVTSAASSTC